MEIIKVSNGYIVTIEFGRREVFKTLDQVFDRALLHFEGRADGFSGSAYGSVDIRRDEPIGRALPTAQEKEP